MCPPRALLALCLIFTAGCGAEASLPSAETKSSNIIRSSEARASGWIVTEQSAKQPVPSRIDAPARLVVRNELDTQLSIPSNGRVREVLVREGARVAAGDALVRFDSAEAAQARAEVSTTAIELRAAQAELSRQERLAASGVGLAVEHLRAEADVRRSRAAHAAALSTAELYGPGTGASVTLSAPAAGVVTQVTARPGMMASADSGPLVSVVPSDALLVRLDVYEDELHRVKIGQSVAVSPTDGSLPATGSVVEVASAADPATRRGPVFVELEEVPQDWVSGRLLRGRIHAEPAAELVVPVASVVIRPDRSRVVYVDEEGQLVPRVVEVGRVVDGQVPVLAGLSPDEHVVVQGALLVDSLADQLL